MKVLMINSSAHQEGCTYTALKEMETEFDKAGIEVELMQVGSKPIHDCIACNKCSNLDNACVFDDVVNRFLEKAKEADAFVFGSPVYYAHPSGRLLDFMNRAFYAGDGVFEDKPAAAVFSARRAGTTASFDVVNKFFTISNMPVVSSSYWNGVHGNSPEEVKEDLEGLQTMRNLAKNMVWLLQCMKAAEDAGIAKPEREAKIFTNFIR